MILTIIIRRPMARLRDLNREEEKQETERDGQMIMRASNSYQRVDQK